jgi:hypothetical protein
LLDRVSSEVGVLGGGRGGALGVPHNSPLLS